MHSGVKPYTMHWWLVIFTKYGSGSFNISQIEKIRPLLLFQLLILYTRRHFRAIWDTIRLWNKASKINCPSCHFFLKFDFSINLMTLFTRHIKTCLNVLEMAPKWCLVCKIKICKSKSALRFLIKATIWWLWTNCRILLEFSMYYEYNFEEMSKNECKIEMVAQIEKTRPLLLLQLLILHTRCHFLGILKLFKGRKWKLVNFFH